MAAAGAPAPQVVADDSGELVKQRFEEFLQKFTEADADESDAVATYVAQASSHSRSYHRANSGAGAANAGK